MRLKEDKYKFGDRTTTFSKNGDIISESWVFRKNGKPHDHPDWELCTVVEGAGRIVVKKDDVETPYDFDGKGFLAIPPGSEHWMEPKIEGGKEEGHFAIAISYVPDFPYS